MSIAPEDVNEIIITDETTLLKYTEPFEVVDEETIIGASGSKKQPKEKKDSKVDKSGGLQEILNMISPPLEFEANGKRWKQQSGSLNSRTGRLSFKVPQSLKDSSGETSSSKPRPIFSHRERLKVSMEPVTRADVHKLGESLNIRLRTRQARSAGICSVRLDLFSQLFDELIRQVTRNSGERGLLLLRIRDELRMTLATHAALYEGSVVFGSKKASEAEEGQDDFMEDITSLNEDNNKIRKDIRNLKFKYQMMEIRAEEIKLAQQKKHKDEIAFLNKTNQQLKGLKNRLEEIFKSDSEGETSETDEAQLESIIAPKK